MQTKLTSNSRRVKLCPWSNLALEEPLHFLSTWAQLHYKSYSTWHTLHFCYTKCGLKLSLTHCKSLHKSLGISHTNHRILPKTGISAFPQASLWNYFKSSYTSQKSSFLWNEIKLIIFQMHLLWMCLDFNCYFNSWKQEGLCLK